MANIHFILQGKGGVGKSLIAALMMQYQKDRNQKTIAIDTDPVNASFAAYSAFSTKRIELLDEHQNLKPVKFDDLMELIFANEDADFIIDNGASSFLPLSSYLVENQVMPMLKEMGHRVIVHTVVTGGQAMMDTLHGFSALAQHMDVSIVVWLNEYFGEVRAKGKHFEEMKVYENHRDKVITIININKMSPLFEQDFQRMIEKHLTFAQALEDEDFNVMAKNRLRLVQKNLYGQLGQLNVAVKMEQADVVAG